MTKTRAYFGAAGRVAARQQREQARRAAMTPWPRVLVMHPTRSAWHPLDGPCPICQQQTRAKDFVSDHCHTTGANRAYICRLCNTGLGMFKDRPAALRRAALYLEHHARIHGSTPSAIPQKA